jgi:translation initiation factor IF-1
MKAMQHICIKCGAEIPAKRIQILPGTKTCVQCSDTSKVVAHAIVAGKTEYSELQIIDQREAANLRYLGKRTSFSVSDIQKNQPKKRHPSQY